MILYWKKKTKHCFFYSYLKDGSTPLHAAVIAKHEKTVKYLIFRNGSVYNKDESKMTPLHYVRIIRIELINIL